MRLRRTLSLTLDVEVLIEAEVEEHVPERRHLSAELSSPAEGGCVTGLQIVAETVIVMDADGNEIAGTDAFRLALTQFITDAYSETFVSSIEQRLRGEA